jgi:hypothetical protein
VPVAAPSGSPHSVDRKMANPPSAQQARPLPSLRLRPPRHPRKMPRMRPHPETPTHQSLRMTRRLFTILSVLSLLSCVAVCAVWAANPFVTIRDRKLANGAHEQVSFGPDRSVRWMYLQEVPRNAWWKSQLPNYNGPVFHGTITRRVPYWWFIVATLPLPLLWLSNQGWRYIRRLQRRAEGRCPICAYDLRATPDRCPECGHIPKSKQLRTA